MRDRDKQYYNNTTTKRGGGGKRGRGSLDRWALPGDQCLGNQSLAQRSRDRMDKTLAVTSRGERGLLHANMSGGKTEKTKKNREDRFKETCLSQSEKPDFLRGKPRRP